MKRYHPEKKALTSAIGLAVAIAFATTNVAVARDVDGQSVTIYKGYPLEDWTLRNGARLVVTTEAQAKSIQAVGGSIVEVQGGGQTEWIDAKDSTLKLRGGFITSSESQAAPALRLENTGATISGASIKTLGVNSGELGRGIVVDSVWGDEKGSNVVLDNSVVHGTDAAASVSYLSELNISGSTLVGDGGATAPSMGAGLRIYAGRATISGGSSVTGNANGIHFGSDTHSTEGTKVDGALIVDASSISGGGAAIFVNQDANADILIRNGAQLASGTNILLDVASGSANFVVDGSSLSGDIAVQSGAAADVVLRNAASLSGTITNATSATVSGGGHWLLTGDSSVGHLSLGSEGLITLGDGDAFHRLTVGSFLGSGGTLMFHRALEADSSPGDFLHIEGDSSGEAFVSVRNVNGIGALTAEGVKLIQVDGNSGAAFTLAGRAVAGAYDYFLYQGSKSNPDDGNWYLRSELPPSPCLADPSLPGCDIVIPDPCEIDPSLPQCGPIVPVLRPEPGAYLANVRAAEMMFRTDYHSRHDGQNHGRGWIRVDGNRNSYDALNQQLDITGNSQAVHVGMDLLSNESGSGFGVMLASGNATSTAKSHLTEYSARGKVRGQALGIYGTLRAFADEDPYAGLYIDGWLQRQQFRNKVEGAGLITERYDSKAWQGAVEAGYAFRLTGDAVRGGLYLEPQLQVGYTDINNRTHVEANGTIVDTQEAGGIFARAGLRLSGVTRWEGAAAQVQPYLQANWLYNKRDEALLFDSELVDNRIPASKLEIGGGASIKFAGGLGAWAGLAVQSTSGYRSTSAQLGMSYSW